MPQLLSIPAPLRLPLAEAFDSHEKLRPVLDAILEGHLGRLFVLGSGPDQAFAAELGCYTFLAGNPASPAVAEVLKTIRPPHELVPPCPAWRSRVRELLGDVVSDRPMESFSSRRIDRVRLPSLLEAPNSTPRIVRLDEAEACQLDRELEPHGLQTFSSPGDLAHRGIAFGAMEENRLVAVASSYAIASSGVEIAIATRPSHRRRGLAAQVAAAMIEWCQNHDLEAHWNASNPVSRHLARRLGLEPTGWVDILFVSRS